MINKKETSGPVRWVSGSGHLIFKPDDPFLDSSLELENYLLEVYLFFSDLHICFTTYLCMRRGDVAAVEESAEPEVFLEQPKKAGLMRK